MPDLIQHRQTQHEAVTLVQEQPHHIYGDDEFEKTVHWINFIPINNSNRGFITRTFNC